MHHVAKFRPTTTARRDVRAAELAGFVQATVRAAPPLTKAQRERVAALLR